MVFVKQHGGQDLWFSLRLSFLLSKNNIACIFTSSKHGVTIRLILVNINM